MKFSTQGFFGVTDYESELNIQKSKMSNPIWRIRTEKAKSYAVNGFLRHTFFS